MFAELFFVSIALSVLKGVTLLVSYINNNAFPQPLNEQEEARYLKILSKSKTEPFTLISEVENARNTLVEHNLRLVAHLVKKFDGTGEDGDDLISIGTIGLIKGINTFDPNKGTKLATYAARCIENATLTKRKHFYDSVSFFLLFTPNMITSTNSPSQLIFSMRLLSMFRFPRTSSVSIICENVESISFITSKPSSLRF